MASSKKDTENTRSPDPPYTADLGSYEPLVDRALIEINKNHIITRIWQQDHTVWKQDPAEISNRLGWLKSPVQMQEKVSEIKTFIEGLRKEAYTHALLMGMGGSSLASEVMRSVFGFRREYLNLYVLDSTHPDAVTAFTEKLNPLNTLYIAATKSGGTVETLSFLKYFYYRAVAILGSKEGSKRFVAITDPGSSLETLAREHNFGKIFLNDPNIGGRYSALSFFGLLPASLMGVDVDMLLERATTMAGDKNGCSCPIVGDNPGAWLGAIIGQLAMAGRDKLTLTLSPDIARFGIWLEQLIAESTGKEGTGILPVHEETLQQPDAYGNDRLFVYIRLKGDASQDGRVLALRRAGQPVVQINIQDLYDLGGEFLRWEMAVAVAGHLMKINPFDQPNVESAKVRARQMLSACKENERLPEVPPTIISDQMTVYASKSSDSPEQALLDFLLQTNVGNETDIRSGYVALQVFLRPSSDTDKALSVLRVKIAAKTKKATTTGYGPQFLHSTGQLHKGDSGHGLFIQFTSDIDNDALIPDEMGEETGSITFGMLLMAQALGDRQALLDAERQVIRFHLGKDVNGGLQRLAKALEEVAHE